MHTIHLHTIPYQIPSRWDELSRSQLVRIAALTREQLRAANIAKLFFLILTQSLPWWQRIRLQWFIFHQATTEERGDLLMLTRSFSEFPDFTQQKIGSLNVPRSKTLHGPLSKFANLTFWEYILAEKYFLSHLRTRDTKDLDKLIAVLYRPPRKDYDPDTHTDIRVPLIDSSIPSRAEAIAKLQLSVRTAILMWFDGCRQHLIRSFPEIYPKPKKEKEQNLHDRLGLESRSGTNWVDLISQLSTTMMDFERIGGTNLSIAMTDISARLKKARTQPKRKPTPKRHH